MIHHHERKDTSRGLVSCCFAGLWLAFLTISAGAQQPAKLEVRVANEFGFPVATLKAPDFAVSVDHAPRPVQAVRYQTDSLVDVVLLLETSELGHRLRGEIEHVAALFVERLSEKEQMAVAGYATSAELVQDFTSSKPLLKQAIAGLRYGNRPALLDSLFAVLDGAYQHAAGRRVLVVIGSGLDSRSKVERREALQVARRNAVSVFAISFAGDGGLEKITEETAGDFYKGRELKQIQQLVTNVAAAWRGHYELELAGPPIGAERVKVEVRQAGKMRVSWRVP